MRKSIQTATISSILALAVIVSSPAFGAPTSVTNGDFQLGDNGATSISGWTAIDERIDLGVTPIAGCVTADTSNYSILREYLYEALRDEYGNTYIEDITSNSITYEYRNFEDVDANPILVLGNPLGWETHQDPDTGDSVHTLFLEVDANTTPRGRVFEGSWTSAQRNAVLALAPDPTVAGDHLADEWDRISFNVGLRSNSSIDDTYVENWQAFDENLVWTSQFVELFSSMSSDENLSAQPNGYVVHGPAIYSEEFTAKTVDDLSLKFAASDDGDDYKVFGYLLNTATCAQTEVIDTTGLFSTWQTVRVAVPANGNYRFVFVSGTYDQSWGGVAGAGMFVDDVVLSPNQERVAEAAAAAAAEAARTAPAATLAKTGADVEWLALGSLVAVVTGVGFFAIGRRKRTL